MTTTADAVDIAVGVQITSYAQLEALPVNTVLHYKSAALGVEDRYTKTGDDSWSPHSDPHMEWTHDHFALDGTNTVESLPPKPGDVLSTEAELNALPLGTRVRKRGSHTRWVRTAEGFLSQGGLHRRAESMLNRRVVTVVSVPDGGEGEVVTVVPDDTSLEVQPSRITLGVFKQRFHTSVYGAAQGSGVSTHPLDTAMPLLEVEEVSPYVGMYVNQHDHRLLANLPNGTLLQVGEDKSVWETYGLYGMHHGSTLMLLGGADWSHTLARIVHMPDAGDPPEWVTAEATAEDADAIREFQRKAWSLGLEAKEQYDWCSEYERAMQRCGIGPWVEDTVQTVNADEAAALPEGSILRYVDVLMNSVLLRRDDRANNPAKTVRIGGALQGHWAKDRLIVLREGPRGNHRDLPVLLSELPHMPVGTQITDGYTYWERTGAPSDQPARVWFASGNRYGHRSGDFGDGLTYRRLP